MNSVNLLNPREDHRQTRRSMVEMKKNPQQIAYALTPMRGKKIEF